MGDHQAEEGRGRRQARPAVLEALARESSSRRKEGGGDPDGNSALANAIQKARDNSMPKDNIERAIQAGAGAGDGYSYEHISYEGYGPGGVAVICSILTDNRNRTASDLRHIFTRTGSLATPGSVAWHSSVAASS